MKTSDNGRKLIEFFEGLILQSYDDYNDHIVHLGDIVHGTLTIGYGHTNAAGPPHIEVGTSWTKEQADNVLAGDLAKVEATVSYLAKVPLSQNQFDALVSFEFNTGALGKSTLLKLLNQNNYNGAADEFLKWTHANGKELAGLIRRRQAERKLFLTPTTIQTQGTTMNSLISILTTLLGPGTVGGIVRAGVASGLTLAATKYAPGVDASSFVPDIAALASTVVVGLWSALGKKGSKTTTMDVVNSIAQQTNPQPQAGVTG